MIFFLNLLNLSGNTGYLKGHVKLQNIAEILEDLWFILKTTLVNILKKITAIMK
jgi:hypothetical protein